MKEQKKMIKPENYTRIKVKLVKGQNKDPMIINEYVYMPKWKI